MARGLCIGLLGVGMAKSFILHSYLIPRRLLISLANLSSSASPESGREGSHIVFMNIVDVFVCLFYEVLDAHLSLC